MMAWRLRWKLMVYISYGMYMLSTLVLDCLKPIFNTFGTAPSAAPISNRISVHRPRCRIELSIPGDAIP